MATPRAYTRPEGGHGGRTRRRRGTKGWKIGFLLVFAAVFVALLLAAFSSPSPSFQASLGDDSGLLPTGRPALLDIARQGDLAVQLPVAQQAVTALGYHRGTAGALSLDPVGRQVNEGLFARIFNRLTGRERNGVTYYQLSGGRGSQTGALDIGAPAGTVVYAPVDGTVVSIRDYVLDGKPRAQRIDIVPNDSPSVVVFVTRLRADPSLTVGSPIQAQTSKIGVIRELSRMEEQALARVTGEAGNHVTIEIHPAATLALR